MNEILSPPARLLNGWRLTGWGCLIALLILPALAMQMTSEVNWTASDFVFAAILLGFLGGVVELAVRYTRNGTSRIGFVLAGLTAFLTFWVNAAVGIIGDDDSVNMFFFVMVVAALVAAALLRFRLPAMRWITASLVVGQYLVGVAALSMMPGHAVEWGFLTIFALFWTMASLCFRRTDSLRRPICD